MYGLKKYVLLKQVCLFNSSFSAMIFNKVLLPDPFPPQKIVISLNSR